MNPNFQPDYTNLPDVLHNRRPKRLPLYEHHIDAPFISMVLDREIGRLGDWEIIDLSICSPSSKSDSSILFGDTHKHSNLALITHCSLFIVHCSLFITHCS